MDLHKDAAGEIQLAYKENIRGRSVYIVQSCSTPVYDNVMELLLLVTAARRAGAKKVTVVIPYFAFKYHKRGAPISTKHSSRFLWSAGSDFAKMLEAAGVDMVISVDLQRFGQGHEACFFDSSIPVETIDTTRTMAEYLKRSVSLNEKVVVVAANPNCAKKAIKFKNILSEGSNLKTDHAIYLYSPDRESEFLGTVRG
jgi:ribose-phosphate pyrophosphokinase